MLREAGGWLGGQVGGLVINRSDGDEIFARERGRGEGEIFSISQYCSTVHFRNNISFIQFIRYSCTMPDALYSQ